MSRTYISLLAALLASACASTPPPALPASAVPAHFAQPVDAQAPLWPSPTWWQGFHDEQLDGLIALSGLVTTLPLICFAQAVRKVSLVTIGVIQYMSPTLSLVVAVLVYGEDFEMKH